jgi:CRP-like cAMP-binding protein
MTLEARRTDDLSSRECPEPPGAEGRTIRVVAGGEAAVPDIPRGSWQRIFPLPLERQLTRARHSIYRAGHILEGIPVVHSGWAARVRRLSDGRRQILSFILPGDLISAGAVFSERLSFFVDAITDVRHAVCKRVQLDEILAQNPRLLHALVAECLAEKTEVEELATDLGRRRAEERVARLFLQLKNRLQALGQAAGMSFDMPLRQQHIADATGMTVIHVGRVLGALRNEGVIQIDGGVLTIIDLAALQRLSDA